MFRGKPNQTDFFLFIFCLLPPLQPRGNSRIQKQKQRKNDFTCISSLHVYLWLAQVLMWTCEIGTWRVQKIHVADAPVFFLFCAALHFHHFIQPRRIHLVFAFGTKLHLCFFLICRLIIYAFCSGLTRRLSHDRVCAATLTLPLKTTLWYEVLCAVLKSSWRVFLENA